MFRKRASSAIPVRSGEAASAARAPSWFQSAMNSCDEPSAVRPLVQLIRPPSGEKDAMASNPSVNVVRTGSRSPRASTKKSSKLPKPCLLEAKMA